MSSSSLSPYRPLKGRGSIRFLRVNRAADMSIHGTLREFCLYSPVCPDYTTFSYAWHEHDTERHNSPHPITLNKQAFPVLDNVYAILAEICNNLDFVTTRWVWIDSVCIDQTNEGERAAQVALMRHVYTQSAETIVWLGEASASSDQAMAFMLVLRDHHSQLAEHPRPTSHGSGRIPPSMEQLNDPKKWKALEHLLERPWWFRVWTLQELILPPHIRFFCGNKSIQRRDLWKAVASIFMCNPPNAWIAADAWLVPWRRSRLYEWWTSPGPGNEMPLPALMAYTSNSRYSNARDRLYSILGLTTDIDRDIAGQPTYDRTVEEVYTDYVVSFVEARQNLDIICFAHLFRATTKDTPSWVPDWRRAMIPQTMPVMVSQSGYTHIGNLRPISHLHYGSSVSYVYKASRSTSPEASFSHNNRCLTCRGMVIGQIDGIGTVWERYTATEETRHSHRLVQSTGAVHLGTASQGDRNGLSSKDMGLLLEELVRTFLLDRGDLYLSESVSIERYRDAFLAAARSASKDSYAEIQFRDWMESNLRLLIRGVSLGDILSTATQPDSKLDRGASDDSEMITVKIRETAKHLCRRLVTINDGSIGMAPELTRKGDLVCVLFGCSVPVVLRERATDGFEFIGEAYVHQHMNGQLLLSGRETEEFALW